MNTTGKEISKPACVTVQVANWSPTGAPVKINKEVMFYQRLHPDCGIIHCSFLWIKYHETPFKDWHLVNILTHATAINPIFNNFLIQL